MNKISIKQTASNRGAKTYKFLGGGNLGNETMTMRLSQRELIDLCIVMNLETIASDSSLTGAVHTQRKYYPDHAKNLAIYGLLGLVRITIKEYQHNKQNISQDILDIIPELQGGDSSYQAFQPIVANLLGCLPGGTDLTINQLERTNPISGNTELVHEVYEVVLAPVNRISLLDGQHRLGAFIIIDKWLQDIVQLGQYPKKGLYVPELKSLKLTPELLNFWTDVFLHATNTATLSVEVHLGLNSQQSRQVFNDLNGKTKRTEISLQHEFDRGDAVNKIIMEDLIGKYIPWDISQSDQEDWSQDDGSLVRKYLNPITALAMFGKTSSKGITPSRASKVLLNATNFWDLISKIPNFGKIGAKANTVAAQPVVLKGIAKLFYDLGSGNATVRNDKDFNTLATKLRKVDFSHTNDLWGSLILDSATRSKNFPGIEDYVFVPKGTNLDAGTLDPNYGWVRYGMKHNDIYPRIGDLIRYTLKLNPRPSVMKSIAKEKNSP
jgi:hypothetical protein